MLTFLKVLQRALLGDSIPYKPRRLAAGLAAAFAIPLLNTPSPSSHCQTTE